MMNTKNFCKALASVLVMVLVVLGARLALQKPAAAASEKEQEAVLQFLLPESGPFTELAYSGEDASIRRVFQSDKGFVIETEVSGYVDDIRLLVGVSKDGLVQGITLRDMGETLGLGTGALTDYHFLMQFLHTNGNAEVGQNVDAMTGATVTSKAIARGVNSAAAYVTGADVSSGATSWGG